MDINCNMEFQFSVPNNLNDSDFGESSTGIHDKLDLGTGQLLDSVSVSTSCDTADKHLTPVDFNLDLGPASDLVSSTDFHLETPVSDIASEPSIEECSEGYSIVNAALEGTGSLPKQVIPASCSLNLSNVTNVQTFQLNQVNLSTIQSMQVIPIENMQVLSSLRPVQPSQKIQSVLPGTMKLGIPGVVSTQSPTAGVMPTHSTAAVMLGNILLIQSLPRQVCIGNNFNTVTPTTSENTHRQVLQIQNMSSSVQIPNLINMTSQDLKAAQHMCGLAQSQAIDMSQMYSPEATVSSILESRNSDSFDDKIDRGNVHHDEILNMTNVQCDNIMASNSHTCNSGDNLLSTDKTKLQDSAVPENADTQKNTKILVYGNNIALTFDCRNQKYVLNSIAKAMHSPQMSKIQGDQNNAVNSVTKNLHSPELNLFPEDQSKVMNSKVIPSPETTKIHGNSINIGMNSPEISKIQVDKCKTFNLEMNSENQTLEKNSCNSFVVPVSEQKARSTQAIKYVSILGSQYGCGTVSASGMSSNKEDGQNLSVIYGKSQATSKDNSHQVHNDVDQSSCLKNVNIKALGTRDQTQIEVIGQNDAVKSQRISDKGQHTEDIKPMAKKRKQDIKITGLQQAVITVVDSPKEQRPLVKYAEGGKEKGSDYQYSCDLCSATFNSKGNYNRHSMIHNLNGKDNFRYKCEECGRLFLQRCDMKRHKLIHSKQEPFKCSECGKGYIRKSDLVIHMRFHKKEKPFRCLHCGNEFYQSGDLNRHMRNVHLHLQSSQLKCGHCDRQYTKEASLIRHMQSIHRDIIIKSLQDKFRKEENKGPPLNADKECVASTAVDATQSIL